MSKVRQTLLESIKNREGNTFINLFDRVFSESRDKEELAMDIAKIMMDYNLPEAMRLNFKLVLGDSWKSQGLSPKNVEMVMDALEKCFEEKFGKLDEKL